MFDEHKYNVWHLTNSDLKLTFPVVHEVDLELSIYFFVIQQHN